MVSQVGLEPTPLSGTDFKSVAAPGYATVTFVLELGAFMLQHLVMANFSPLKRGPMFHGTCPISMTKLVLQVGVEPTRISPLGFESSASASSAIVAFNNQILTMVAKTTTGLPYPYILYTKNPNLL